MTNETYPVDLWVMGIEDDANVQRVDSVVQALFAEDFEWHYGRADDMRKGVVRQIDEQTAEVARKALDAVGARTLIDEEAYTEPGLWLSSITPEENRRDAFAIVEKYLSDPRGARGGVL